MRISDWSSDVCSSDLYAHTPDAIEAAIAALKPHATGRLIVMFGAGGDRDVGKRETMGRVAAAHADLVIVTDDNPRTEPPAAIRARSEEHTSELQSLMRISYAVFCLKKKNSSNITWCDLPTT